MRAPILRKIFLYASNVTLLLCVFFAIRLSFNKPHKMYNDNATVSLSDVRTNRIKNINFKYILQWTSPRNVPFDSMGIGQEGFRSRQCPYTNCIVTSQRDYLMGVTEFDVIAFSGPEVLYFPEKFLPETRADYQKYVFASIESPENYPVCSNRFDSYFNWTWTYKLDSDVRWGYIDIRDSTGEIIGPNKVMHWMDLKDMKPVSEELKQRLKTKTKAAAWFVSNCADRAGRFTFALNLELELKKHNLALDIYGDCGRLSCPRSKDDNCMDMVEKKYFFYLSFENSFSEDYVTEKLLKALKRNIVPIVFGGANYTRFMPKGIYLDARELGVAALAAKMATLIKDSETYASFFKWKSHYSYHSKHETPKTNEYCHMCALLNDESRLNEITVLKDFRDWWDGPILC